MHTAQVSIVPKKGTEVAIGAERSTHLHVIDLRSAHVEDPTAALAVGKHEMQRGSDVGSCVQALRCKRIEAPDPDRLLRAALGFVCEVLQSGETKVIEVAHGVKMFRHGSGTGGTNMVNMLGNAVAKRAGSFADILLATTLTDDKINNTDSGARETMQNRKRRNRR